MKWLTAARKKLLTIKRLLCKDFWDKPIETRIQTHQKLLPKSQGKTTNISSFFKQWILFGHNSAALTNYVQGGKHCGFCFVFIVCFKIWGVIAVSHHQVCLCLAPETFQWVYRKHVMSMYLNFSVLTGSDWKCLKIFQKTSELISVCFVF